MKMVDGEGIISDELRSIIENTNDLIFVKNRDSVYIASSKNYALNCVRCNGVEDVIGKTDYDLFADRTMAEKYRADDKELFESGKAMIEFEEEYPDRDGTKHHCLTTKYLLHDKEGKPVAIFGQYHDIGKQAETEIARRREIDRHVTDALSKSFFAANYADLKTHKYVTVGAMDYARKMVESCQTIEEAFEAFIHTLVKAEFQEKMREFCDTKTIADRVKGQTQIDCEYLSNVAKGWCRASFFPTEWDERGEVTHVLFAVSSIDENKAQEIEESIVNKRDLETIFDEVPGGIVLFEWDGKDLKALKISKYYQDLYGDSMLNDIGRVDFVRIHPDDLAGYQKAVKKALDESHHLECVFRAWAQRQKRYVWTQINAISKPQEDGKSLVYAIYTDVTDQKNAELALAKKQASLEAALNVSNQLCCEYDPVLQEVDCFTETNFFHIPTPLRNYPDCVREVKFIHPDDVELFIDTVHSTDDGMHSAICDIRALCEGEYRWYSCRLEPYFDSEKDRNVIILTIIDATLRISSIQNYEERIQSLLSMKESAAGICTFNLTRNTFEVIDKKELIEPFVKNPLTFEDVMLAIVDYINGEKEQKTYREQFCGENLLRQAENGNMHIQMENLLKISEDHYEWVISVVDMVKNPITNEIGGIAYSKSVQLDRMSKELLGKTLQQDYLFAAVVFVDTDEYYLYDSEKEKFSDRMTNYWDAVFHSFPEDCSEETLTKMQEFFRKSYIVGYLEGRAEFAYAFDGKYRGRSCRLEAKYRYMDENHTMLLATGRNITDIAMMKKWWYDSEHDFLTGLYNRNTVFEKCRAIIAAHPEEQLVMLHGDVQHFHLYNTFFGEEAGDKLLCRIAEVIRNIAKEYEFAAYGRIESDVFCVFFPLQHEMFKRHMKKCVEELQEFSPNFPLRMALGIYLVTDPGMPVEAMFSRATIAAKSHKNHLFNMVSKYDEIMDQELRDTQQITSEMNVAIEEEQFEVYLQPKYSLRSEKLTGAEALVRWNHPVRGMISPGKFIPAFEKNGFVAEVDKYMWEHVCQILRRWQDEGKEIYPVSVNISRVSMYSHATVPFLKSLIEKYQIAPKYLELELTETAYMDDPEDLKQMLHELQEYGFKILMDDFGSGYSSLNTLRELPVDVLKLDMKFLAEIQNDNRGLAVLSSVVRMSKLLKLPIVAEGVETREQADYLRSIGCEYVQGFLFGRPMPVANYEELLHKCSRGDVAENVENRDTTSLATADVVIEEQQISLGILEYENERFAYLRTNKKFLREFGLIENLQPASKVFRDHLDAANYDVLLHAFADCTDSKEDIFFCLDWTADDGTSRRYHGYLHYNGNIGTYADLAVTFVNVTNMRIL